MKKLLIPVLVGLSSMLLLSGCIVLSLGGGTKNTNETAKATVGQQLSDLQKAKESGAISEDEYQAQKKKILEQK
jgi:hypothetical protein